MERRLLQWWHQDATRQLRASLESPTAFHELVGEGVRQVIGRELPSEGEVAWRTEKVVDRGAYREWRGLLMNVKHGEALPTVVLMPRDADSVRDVVVWVDTGGKSGLFEDEVEAGSPRAPVNALLGAGVAVVGIDLFMQGEFLREGEGPPSRGRLVDNPRESAAYTFGYNHSLFAERVHDLLTVLGGLSAASRDLPFAGADGLRVGMVGLSGAGAWVAAARAVATPKVRWAAIDTRHFRFGRVGSIDDINFLPGGAKYLDLPGMIALGTPGALLLAGEGDSLEAIPEVVAVAYRRANASAALLPVVLPEDPLEAERAVVGWLMTRISARP